MKQTKKKPEVKKKVVKKEVKMDDIPIDIQIKIYKWHQRMEFAQYVKEKIMREYGVKDFP